MRRENELCRNLSDKQRSYFDVDSGHTVQYKGTFAIVLLVNIVQIQSEGFPAGVLPLAKK